MSSRDSLIAVREENKRGNPMDIKVLACAVAIAVGSGLLAQGAAADITDFTNWTQVQDPANANFTGSSTMTNATLFADDGAVPLATDIGYQSVNGVTPATSTAGYMFDYTQSFSIAIDYALSFSNNPVGILSLGFGIGEDGLGMNSAGVVMVTQNGLPLGTFAGAARAGDNDAGSFITGLPATLSGSFFASYDAVTGTITAGASQTPGAAAPTATGSFNMLQDQWNDENLLASFFIRSGPIVPWSGGNGEVVFSNFRMLDGQAIQIPAPASIVVFGLLGVGRRRPCRAYAQLN